MRAHFSQRAVGPVVTAMAVLIAALATGSPLFLMAALLISVTVLLCLTSVLWTAATLAVTSLLSDAAVYRGQDVQLAVELACSCFIPIAPLAVTISAGPDRPEQVLSLTVAAGKKQTLKMDFHAAHVGVTAPGVRSVEIRDLLGLFSIEKMPETKGGNLVVLPLPFDVGQLTYAQGDSGTESIARASEDVTSPTELRSYQPGDAMKKIHWKLSLRKQELMVRKYDAPVMPDALVLLDCSQPPRQADEASQADLRDALLETAASIMQENVRDGHPAKLPIHGKRPMELDRGMGLPMILDALARVDFSAPDRFERMLRLEMRRMRKVGCTVVVSARLNSRMIDVMTSMRRMGPFVRFYYVTFAPNDPAVMPMIARLQHAGVEVCHVTPVAL